MSQNPLEALPFVADSGFYPIKPDSGILPKAMAGQTLSFIFPCQKPNILNSLP
ncbi:hypothetical protein AB6849_11135 [Serratia proteamaculans]|uniref:hypothetical protein n=1 Tax=Serratia proteamaculans TaxID=28151 RepID=UPI001C56E351|nr:hypothetical protein [Serratia proteamaculans]WEO87951.1 hypothetical protein JET59_017440 [Serratia proteamaculans]